VGVSTDEWANRRQLLGGSLGEERWICESLGDWASSRTSVRVCRSGYEPKHFKAPSNSRLKTMLFAHVS